MVGSFPFKESTSQKVLIRSKELLELPPLGYSSELQDCLAECLRIDPSKRVSIKENLERAFVQPCIKMISDQVMQKNK